MTTSIEQTASDADVALIERIPALLEAQPLDPAALRRALSALRRLTDSGLAEVHGTELGPLTGRVQGALAGLRAGARAETVGRYVKTTKVHASVLRALAKGPATPSVIAQRSSRAPAVISRALKRLRSEGLVTAATDPDDKRQLIYELTDAGEALAGEVVAFTAEPAPEKLVDHEVVAAALREALDAAVALRRRTSERRDVLVRLKAIAEHAQRVSTPDVRVRALNEFLTTLRQDAQVEAFEPELKGLELIATGEDETIPARYALRAMAHLEYQLGRHPDRSLSVRAGHLVAAHNHFRRLGDDVGDGYWRNCEGWAHAALADNYRQQSALVSAVDSAQAALSIFRELEDPYGLARCHFLLGFCMRLMGRFDQSRQELLEARELTEEHGFRAFGADTLMQLGEVYRCRGQFDEALRYLLRARDQAAELNLTLTSAFAEAALAATMHQQGQDQTDTLKSLDRAQGVFTARHSHDGLALSLRRRSVVLREGGGMTAANLDRAQKYVDQARELYDTMRSPAGIAACHIEDGLLAAKRGRTTQKSCTQLLRLCRRPMMGYWIERDPWVPIMLGHFADETGHEELQELAAGMLSRNTQLTKGTVGKGSAGKDAMLSKSARARVYATRLDHMGGEHRRVSSDATATAFTDDLTGQIPASEPLEIEWRFA